MAQTERKKKILLIAPCKTGRGGVVSMVNALYSSKLKENFTFGWLETSDDRGVFCNIWAVVKAFLLAPPHILASDLVHIHSASYNSFRRKLIFMAWCVLLRRPYLLHIHGGGFKTFLQNATATGKKLYRWGLRHASGVITLADVFDRAAADAEPRQTRRRIIPNPGYLPAGAPHAVGKKIGAVMFAGWLEPAKGVFELLEAFAACGFPPEVQLVMPGKGRIGEVRNAAEKLGIEAQVQTPGWQSRRQMDKWYEQADIFVLPSHTEGMPMVLLEAMAYGVPIITTPVGGIPSMLPASARNFFFRPGCVPELTERLEKLASDPELRKCYSRELQRHYTKNFSGDVIFEKIADFYRDLLKTQK